MLFKDLPKEEQERMITEWKADIEATQDPEQRKEKQRVFDVLANSKWLACMYLGPGPRTKKAQ